MKPKDLALTIALGGAGGGGGGGDEDITKGTMAPNFSAETAYTAGDYVWHSGKLYRFTADHAAGSWDGTDAEEAPLSAGIGDVKSAIDEMTGTKYVVGDEVKTDDYLIDGSGNIVSASNWTINTVDVTSAKKVLVTARAYANNYYYGFYDANNGFLSGLLREESGSGGITSMAVDVPDGAAKIVAVGQTNQPFHYASIYIEEVFSLADNVVERIAPFGYIFSAGVIETGKAISSGGKIQSASNWTLRISPINGASKVKVSARAYYDTYYYAFYDSKDVFISGVKRTESGSGNIVDSVSDVPAGASYIAAVGYSTQENPFATIYLYNQHIPQIWAGKKWTVVGDSLTEKNIRTTMHYYDYVSESTGISVNVMGDSGSGYMKEYDVGTAFYQRISAVPTDSDVITIFGSFNDLSSDLPLGTATDATTETIGGCMNKTLENLFAAYPLAIVGIVTPTPWIYANPYNSTTANEYVELLIAVAERWSVPCLDLYHKSLLRPWDADFRTLAYSKDEGNGVHPDETGHKIIAPRFEAFLDSLLIH